MISSPLWPRGHTAVIQTLLLHSCILREAFCQNSFHILNLWRGTPLRAIRRTLYFNLFLCNFCCICISGNSVIWAPWLFWSLIASDELCAKTLYSECCKSSLIIDVVDWVAGTILPLVYSAVYNTFFVSWFTFCPHVYTGNF